MAKDGFRIMDSDLHVQEPGDMYERYLEERFKEHAPRKERSHISGLEKWVVGAYFTPYWADDPEVARANSALMTKKEKTPFQVKAYQQDFDAPSTIEAMDIEGVDVAILYRTIGGMIAQAMDVLEPEFSAALCRAYNDWLADYCSYRPQRLKGVALVSLQDIELAIMELRRATEELGFVGVSIHPEPVNGRLLYDPEVEPLWAEAERLNVAVGIHGTGTGISQDDLGRRFLDHPAGRIVARSVSFPVPLMWSMSGIISAGILERYPRLRIAFLEGNCGWLPWFLYRLDELHHKHGYPSLERRPSDYFFRNCFISVDVDEELVSDVIRRLGDGNIVLSTDYPHFDSAFPEAIDEFLKLEIPSESKSKILWDNCARFYGQQ